MKPIFRTILPLLLALLVLPIASQAHPGHGEGFLQSDRLGHLFLHPWQCFALAGIGALIVLLARAPWMRWTGGLLASTSAVLLLVNFL